MSWQRILRRVELDGSANTLQSRRRRRERQPKHSALGQWLRFEQLEERTLLAVLLEPSVTIGANFKGTDFNQSQQLPPDTMGAVGPNHVAEILNGAFAVYEKSGQLHTRVSLDAFWNTAFTNAGTATTANASFDPRILYDTFSARWFAAAVDTRRDPDSRILVGVTTGNDPSLGNWRGFTIDADSAGTRWADFPTVGLDSQGLYIFANMFDNVAAGPLASTVTLFGIPKASLTAATPGIAGFRVQENIALANTGPSVQPAVDLGNGSLPLPALSRFNNDNLYQFDIPANFFTGTNIPVQNAANFIAHVTADPPDARQPGPNDNIDTGDARFSGNVVLQNGRLWAVHGVSITGRAAVRWYEINEAANTVVQTGLITDPSLDLYFPSIAVNPANEVVIGFSGSDSDTPISTYFVTGRTASGITTFGPLTQSHLGNGQYERLDGIGRNRWGDYSATVLDPENPNIFWTFQEYVDGNDNWAVRVTEIAVQNVLRIDGDADFIGQDDAFHLIRNGADPSLLNVFVNGVEFGPYQLADLQSIIVNGLGGNDVLVVDSSNGLINVPGGIRFDGGSGFDELRFQQVGGLMHATTTYSVGPNSGQGTHVIAGAPGPQTVFFENLEPVIDVVPSATLVVNATPADNAINYQEGGSSGTVLVGGASSGQVTIDNFEPIEFANKTELVINGLAGSDMINLNNPTTPSGLEQITVLGGDPTTNDRLIVNAEPGRFSPMVVVPEGQGTGRVEYFFENLPHVEYRGIEEIVLVGQLDDGDHFGVDGTAGDDTFEYFSGPAGDQGMVIGTMDDNSFTLPIIYFQGMGATSADARVNVFNSFGQQGGEDKFIFNGAPNGTDLITFGDHDRKGEILSLNAHLQVGTPTDLLPEDRPWGINGPSASGTTTQVFIRSHDGNDRFIVVPEADVMIIVDGGSTGDGSQLSFLRDPAGDDEVLVGWGQAVSAFFGIQDVSVILQSGLGPVFALGIGTVNVAAAGGDVNVLASGGNDVIHFTPTGPHSATVTADRHPTAFNFEGVLSTNDFTISSPLPSKVIFNGTSGRDRIRVDVPNRTVQLDVQDTAFPPNVVVPWRSVTFDGAFAGGGIESVEVRGHGGNDTFHVVPGPAVGDGLFVKIDGGSPLASDALVITDLDGDNNPVPLAATDFVVVGKSRVPDAGNILVFRNAVRLPGIAYENVEVVWPNVAPVDRNTGDPNLLVLGPDLFEPNEFRATAAFLGLASTINVQNLALFPTSLEHIGVPADQDYFRVVAQQTGTLDFQVYFRTFDPTLLPDGGQLEIEVLDAAGIAVTGFTALGATGNARGRIPAVAGQSYYLRVRGETGDVINGYDLTIINTPAAVPFDIELQDTPVGPPPTNSDTGRSQFDNITRDSTPTIFLRLDDAAFRFDLPGNDPGAGGFANNPPVGPIPIPFQILALPGYRVAIFDEGPTPGQAGSNPQIPVGFAEEVAGSPGLYRFTFPEPLSDGSHFISARVQMVDPSDPQQTGFGVRSQSLEIVVDTLPPPVSFGLAGAASDGLHPDSDSGVQGNSGTFSDRITNDTAPTFWGTAEANTAIRAYIDVNQNGIVDDQDILIGATVTLPYDGTNQFAEGRWELTSAVDMNDPEARNLAGGLSPLPQDGLRRILVTAEDVAGNVSAPDVLDIFIDTQGPQITGVFITDTPAFDLFLGKFDALATMAPTPLVHSLSIRLQDLPERIAGFLYEALDSDVAEIPGHYLVRGDFSGVIPIETVQFVGDPLVAGSPATGTIVLNFFSPLPDDRFTLFISDAVADPAGNALDGETNTVEPQAVPLFPSGDGQPGGGFTVRFTVDSRPELGVWAAGTVWVDTNGNFTFDPNNPDFANRDITYVMGFTSDHIFAGNFRDAGADGIAGTADDGPADGFDKLAAYGRVAGQFRWLIDTDNDGVSDPPWGIIDPAGINGLPVAGNFNPAIAGDQVGLFDGTRWHLDTTGNYNVNEVVTIPGMKGYPIVGDFNGDGLVDLATWTDDTFQISLAGTPGGVGSLGWSRTLTTFRFGFIGVRERPVAADMDQDGFTDLGLWVPDRAGVTPNGGGEWYFLISGGQSVLDRIVTDPKGASSIPFTPVPFGNDLYRQFGNEYALPVVGNFDPPPGRGPTNLVGEIPTNVENPFDVNGSGTVGPIDALLIINHLNRHGAGPVAPTGNSSPYLDVNRDGYITALDALLIINYLNRSGPTSVGSLGGGEGEGAQELATLQGVGEGAAVADLRFGQTQTVATDLSGPLDPILVLSEPNSYPSQADPAWDELFGTLAKATLSGPRPVESVGESQRAKDEDDHVTLVDSVLAEIGPDRGANI